MELNKMYYLSSTMFLFKSRINECILQKSLQFLHKTYEAILNVTKNSIDHTRFWSVIIDYAGTGVTFVNLIITARNYLWKQMFFITILNATN